MTRGGRRRQGPGPSAAPGVGFGESTSWAVISDGLHRRPEFAGVMQLAQGIGAIVAGLLASAATGRLGEIRVAAIGTTLFAAGEALQIARNLTVVMAGRVVVGAAFPLLTIAAITLLQRSAPDELRGVYAGFEVVVPQTMSVAIGGWLVGVLDYRLVLAIAGLFGLASALLMLRIRLTSREPDQGVGRPVEVGVEGL